MTIALVTGVSRENGIGAAVARALAADGVDVFITYFRPFDVSVGYESDSAAPDKMLADIQEMGIRAAGLELDLSDPAAPRQLFDHIEKTFGAVNILVNNAAYSMDGGIETLTAEQLDQHYAVNVRGMALLCAEFVRRYQTRPSEEFGRIINLTSGQSVGAMPWVLAYVTTKGAVEAFTVSLSAAVASLGITVNAVDPGATDTGWMSPKLKQELSGNAPMGRVGMPDDASRLIRFLASEEAGWITGQIIHSRGGA